MTDEDDLRSGLRARAADLPVSAVPHRLRAASLRSALRRRRRRQVASGSVALVVAVLVVVVPLGVQELRTSPATPAPSAAVPAPATTPAPDTPVPDTAPAAAVLTLPTRGSLAPDQVFLASLVQQDWAAAEPDADPPPVVPAPADRRVVFAGEVLEARWALVVAEPDSAAPERVSAQWFTGPVSATGEEMQPVGARQSLAVTDPVAVNDPVTGGVVVVAAPGDRVELSDRPDVAADGTVVREWRDVDPVAGVAVDRFVPAVTSDGQAARYRVTRDGLLVAEGRPWLIGFVQSPGIDIAPQGFNLEVALQLLGDLGLPLDEVSFEPVWIGEVPGPAGDTSSVGVVGAVVPSGAFVVAAWDERSTPGLGSSAVGITAQQVVPAVVPADRRVVALHRQATWDDGQVTDDLVVVVPAGATTVTVLGADGARLADLPVVDGAAVATFPAGAASVQVAVPQGAVVTSPIAEGPLW